MLRHARAPKYSWPGPSREVCRHKKWQRLQRRLGSESQILPSEMLDNDHKSGTASRRDVVGDKAIVGISGTRPEGPLREANSR